MPLSGAAARSTEDAVVAAPRVLFLIEATFAGVRRHLVDLITGIDRRHPGGIEIHVGYATPRADRTFHAFLDRLESLGTPSVEIPMTRSPSTTDLTAARQVRQYLRHNEIDLVHAHSAKAGFIGRLAARTTPGVRSLYTPNASPFRLSRAYRILETFGGYALGDGIIAVSPSEHDELVREHIAPASRVHMVMSGIPDEAPPSNPIRHGVNSVGTAGRISAQKSPARFLAIMRRVLDQQPDATFVWIGDGEDRAALEAGARDLDMADRLHITGWVDEPAVHLAGLDVFLLPSSYESFGYVTVEAMRLGLPTVVSAVPGSIDVVDDGSTGYVVPLDDIDEFATSIVGLLADPAERQRMGDGGRLRWREHLHADRMVDETVDLYRRVIDGRRSARR